jgi:hypothetical protein
MTRQRGSTDIEASFGIYQAGFIGFSKDQVSFNALDWWDSICTSWCYDQHDADRWGDQKYLTQIPNLFYNIKISEHPGVNTAPWNLVLPNTNNYYLSFENNDVLINSQKLISYHFGSMRIYNENEFDLWKLDPLTIDGNVLEYLYKPYLNALKQSVAMIKRVYNYTEFLFELKNDVKNYISLGGYK